jgi:hypothetical protein
LAAAVIELAVHDVKHGTAEQRKWALEDIEDGGLEPWVDVLCATFDVYEGVQERLMKMLRGHDGRAKVGVPSGARKRESALAVGGSGRRQLTGPPLYETPA